MRSLEIKGTPLLEKNLEFFRGDKRFLVHQGSSRSSKTYSILQAILIDCFAHQNERRVYTIVRKSFPALRATAYRDFIEMLEEYDLYNVEDHNKSENIYKLNGNTVEFVSVDESQKIRGRKRAVLFVNECNELTAEEFRQLEIRTEEKVVLDYNPSDMSGWHYDIQDQRRDSLVYHKSTYKDNPFLSEEIVKAIESYRESDPEFWEVFGRGERVISKELIFPHWKECAFPDTDKFVYGLDFGFNHPTALVKVFEQDNSLFVKEVIYQSYLTSAELIAMMNSMGIDKKKTMYCDSARPDIITELQYAGYNVSKSEKDVKPGIDYVKSKVINVDPDSNNIKRELGSYKWKKGRSGEVVDEPVKMLDDACDAIRYAAFSGRYMDAGKYTSFRVF
jgi:phage terminase large subunit